MADETTPVKFGPVRSLDEAIHECERELGVRTRIYPRWVKEGKLTQFTAQEQFERLDSAVTFLKRYASDLVVQSAKTLDMPTAATA